MAFSVDEIRDRARHLKADVARERYEIRAGLKERPSFTQIYEEHRVLFAPEVLPAIQRELSMATGDERHRLSALSRWVSRQRVEVDLAPLEDELRSWESGSAVSLTDREIPLRRVDGAIMRAEVRGERLAWEAARNRRLEEAGALRLDVLHRERESIRQLGLGTYVETWERLTGLDLRSMARLAVELLDRTESAYREAFLREVGQRIGAEARSAARSDATWLVGMRWLAQPFAINPLLTKLRADLERMGLPLPRDGVVRIDLDRRPLKVGRSFCAAIRVPGDVVLVVSPVGGWADARSLLHEIGHTLHFAYTEPTLPWEERALGDSAVTESFALLFESLTVDHGWVEAATGLTGRDLQDYGRLAGFLTLYDLRRQAAQFLWEMELAEADRPGELSGRYAEVLTNATGFRHEPVTYLEDIHRGFWIARQLRARMLSAITLDALNDRFGDEWYRNPAAGPFLQEILSAGQREDAPQLATQLGAEGLTPDSLFSKIDGWL